MTLTTRSLLREMFPCDDFSHHMKLQEMHMVC